MKYFFTLRQNEIDKIKDELNSKENENNFLKDRVFIDLFKDKINTKGDKYPK